MSNRGKLLGVRCVRGKIPLDLCRACSLNPLHPCGFTANLLEEMRRQDAEEGRTEFTPSTLLECDRRTVLYTSRDHYLDPEHDWSLHRGHDIHRYFEGLPEPEGSCVCTVREERLTTVVETKYGTQTISGKMDLVVVQSISMIERLPMMHEPGPVVERVARCKIVDYKTHKIDHSLISPDRKHQMQLNIYAWLVENTLLDLGVKALEGVDRVIVDELELVYVDMSKSRRFSSAGQMPAKGKQPRGKEPEMLTLDSIELLDMQDVEDWVVKRIEQKIEAKEVLPPKDLALSRGGNTDEWCFRCPMREACEEAGE